MDTLHIGLPFKNKEEFISAIEDAIKGVIGSTSINGISNTGAERIFTSQEAADFLKISIKTLYTKMHLRQIKYSRPGKYAYFKYSDLLEYINRAGIATQYELEEKAEHHLKKSHKHK